MGKSLPKLNRGIFLKYLMTKAPNFGQNRTLYTLLLFMSGTLSAIPGRTKAHSHSIFRHMFGAHSISSHLAKSISLASFHEVRSFQ